MIEHLTREDAERFLCECFRVLKTEGFIRLVTPDLAYLACLYVGAGKGSTNGTHDAADQFLTNSGLIQEFSQTNALIRFYRRWKSFELHKWLYDEASLGFRLEQVGFSDVKRRDYLESGIPAIEDVEREARLQGALCMEGRKSVR